MQPIKIALEDSKGKPLIRNMNKSVEMSVTDVLLFPTIVIVTHCKTVSVLFWLKLY